ncbi:TIGR02234 family membrane protein [Nocardia panacis]|uniref:TIGR02234 family membrane protein n=1 Tax=Nocardia panacis TaxID=2340916 RepID=A0A3A4K9S7_9NOCA|nr:TIGR02234 family membrane protein [Nocardia panacis]RJO69212.1 TIGR02234 family membrane protein [Nocardia panacis]
MSGQPRKYPIAPAALLAAAAALLWLSSRMTWVTVHSADGLTEPRVHHLAGATWFGALTPLALVLLAAIAAALATRGWLRRLVGVLVALVAAVAAVPGFALLMGKATAERAKTLAELPARAEVTDLQTSALAAVVSLFGAAAALAAAALLARMSERAARLSGKYDNPVFRRAAASARVRDAEAGAAPDRLAERVLWDALDAGADPTEAAPSKSAEAVPNNPIEAVPSKSTEAAPNNTGADRDSSSGGTKAG